MPKASEVANELRMLADALDEDREAAIISPVVYFHASHDKERFLSTVKLLPKPLTKRIMFPDTTYSDFVMEKAEGAVQIHASIARSSMCRIVRPAQPAQYECEPILSQLEEEAIAAD